MRYEVSKRSLSLSVCVCVRVVELRSFPRYEIRLQLDSRI